ncbi:MAG: aldehyde dehydrogenase family protein, partial [Lachnospiraceae bacterium]|nr:aldehyde dehydrogenase family protein [Lachnospiraceae bacterium]
MTEMERMGQAAKAAEQILALADTETKNRALLKIAEKLTENADTLLQANAKDVQAAREDGRTSAFIDRLTLTEERIRGIARGVREVADLTDPVGDILSEDLRPNGLRIVKKRVPIGVVGMIFESRPNVVFDAAVLSLKAGNCSILRGGKEAINSNVCSEAIMQEALAEIGLPKECIQLVKDTSRASSEELM